MVRGPIYSPLNDPQRALGRRNLVLHRMQEEGKITPSEEAAAKKTPLGLHIQYPRNDLAPYFFEELRKYLESTYGTEAVHERGLRVYTTLNVAMQRAANLAVRDGLHAYDRRPDGAAGAYVLKDNLGTLEAMRMMTSAALSKGSYVTGW
jgi:penicillin-binding protein 1A